MRTSAIAIAALYALVALPRSAIPLIDGDVWWHIRAGQEVMSTASVPRVDAWSIVGSGSPWVSQDWLTNVLMASAASLGVWGWMLLSVGFAVAVAASLAILLSAIRVRLGPRAWFGAVVWLAFGLTVAGPTLGVRAQVVDLPLAAGVMWLLWKYIDSHRSRWLVGLPLIAIVWANLHAGWAFIFLLGGAVLVGEAADRRLGRAVGTPPLTWTQLRALAIALLASAGALMINPNGFELLLYPMKAGIGALPRYLAEWAPPRWDQLPGQLLVAFVLLGVVPSLIWARRWLRTADLLILVGLTVMAFSAARFLLVAGPLCAAIVAVGLGRATGDWRFGLRRMIDRMGADVRSSRQATGNLVLVVSVLALGVAITAARVSPHAQTSLVAEHMPVAAVDWIVSNHPGERPFNTYSWGGYLGWRQPTEPIFIDGRADIYGEAPIRMYADTVTLKTDPELVFDRFSIDYILFNTGSPLGHWLDESDAWERAYGDDLAGVWVRSG